MNFHSLRSFVDHLQRAGLLKVVSVPVSAKLEAAEIHRRVIGEGGPALLFENITGAAFPLVTNLFGTKERIHMAFGVEPQKAIEDLCQLVQGQPSLAAAWSARTGLRRLLSLGSRTSSKLGLITEPPDLMQLPLLTSWPEDGGAFCTLPLVYTESPDGKSSNLGMYRLQRFSATETGFHCQIGKGAGFHLFEYEQLNRPMPVTIMLGASPALILSAISPLPENVPELLFASFLEKKKIKISKSCGVSGATTAFTDAEYQLLGEVVPHQRRSEGPFGDHYGYYSLAHDFPVFRAKQVLRKKRPIIPATVVGIPPQEDLYIGDYLQELFAPLLKITMPQVKELWSYGAAGFHALSAARVQERYRRESLNAAFRILGEGQLSLTKTLLVTNQVVNLKSFRETLAAVLARMDPERDILVLGNTSLDTLDYTGEELNLGSKLILFGAQDVAKELPKSLPEISLPAAPFSAGCLVVQAASYVAGDGVAQSIAALPQLESWPLVIITDEDPKALCADETTFLWKVFLRFEAARDLYTKQQKVIRNQLAFSFPLVIDARMKPWYPRPVEVDPDTKALVDRRWGEY